MTTSLNSSKWHGVKRRETGTYAVTPRTHGVTTAYAVYDRKAIYLLGDTDGVKNGVTHNLSDTPVTAIHSMA